MDDRTISVVMPVHNALPYLDAAVESILAQTLSAFEFVIYDDGSTDGSAERLEHWARRDERIKLIHGERKLGPAASSNAVVGHSTGALIARMDADDISLADRLEVEAKTLAARPDAGMVASLCDVIDSDGRQIRPPELWRLTRRSWFTPFPHGSMMFRRTLFEKIGGYRLECEFWEDLDLAIRASREAKILVIPRPLYRYRQSTASTRLASNPERVENALDLRYRAIDEVRRSGSYDQVLRDGRRTAGQRIDPRVFVSLGLLSLWAGQRPSLVRRMLERARLRPDRATIIALGWLPWARVVPGLAGRLLNLLSRMRNDAVAPLDPEQPVEWRPPLEQSEGETSGRA